MPPVSVQALHRRSVSNARQDLILCRWMGYDCLPNFVEYGRQSCPQCAGILFHTRLNTSAHLHCFLVVMPHQPKKPYADLVEVARCHNQQCPAPMIGASIILHVIRCSPNTQPSANLPNRLFAALDQTPLMHCSIQPPSTTAQPSLIASTCRIRCQYSQMTTITAESK